MKTFLNCVIILVLAAGAGRAAQPAGAFGYDPRALFEQLDANHDQVIDRSEVPESGLPAFEQLLKHGDADKNGKLDLGEYRALVAGLRGEPRPGGAGGPGGGAGGLAAMDANGDGKVSKVEFTGPPALFTRIDTDKDGFITREEAQKFRAAGGAAGGTVLERLKAMDSNGDGKVSRAEFTGPEPMFQRLDADKDGFITQDEARNFQGSPAGAAAVDAALAQRFRVLDENGDGKLSRGEFPGPDARFQRFDTNKDRSLSLDEFRAGRVAEAKPPGGAGAAQVAPDRPKE